MDRSQALRRLGVLRVVAIAAAAAAVPLPVAASLTLTPPTAVSFAGLTLTGIDTSTSAQPSVTVADSDVISSGWNLTLSTTAFAGPGGATIPEPALSIPSAPTVTCTAPGGVCASSPTNAVTYPVSIPQTNAAVKWFDAASTTGLGTFAITPTLKLALPSRIVAGTFTATETWSLNSGP